jgi:phytoene synthase
MRVMPAAKRRAMYAIYAWMRAADDLADEQNDPQQNATRLEQFREMTMFAMDRDGGVPQPLAAGGESVWPAVRHTLLEHEIPADYLNAMIDGQLLDQHKTRYDTFEQLYDYCYKVASVVGLVCITVWGHDGAADVQRMAERRGVALQLTNILRDLVEDARRGRLYLPGDELRRFGFEPDELVGQLAAGSVNGRFEQLMAYQVDRARSYYQQSAGLEAHIDAKCRPASWAIMRIYRGLLDKIAAHPRRVLRGRVRLSGFNKATVAIRALCRCGIHT